MMADDLGIIGRAGAPLREAPVGEGKEEGSRMASEDTSAIGPESRTRVGRMPLEDLAPAFRRLDRLIGRALVAAQHAYGPEALADGFRGLHISEKDATRLLAREPMSPAFVMGDSEDVSPQVLCECPRLRGLTEGFGLSPFA